VSSTSPCKAETIRQAFIWNPRKSVWTVGRELNIPRSTMHDVLNKHFRFHGYKIQHVQQRLDQCCATFFSLVAHPNLSDTWWHITKFRLTKRRYKTIHGHKYVSTYKYLPKKNASMWGGGKKYTCWIKLSMMNQCVCVCVYHEF
jgi:hypothetical protein